MRTWTRIHYRWLSDQKFQQPAQQTVFQDYVNAVQDADERLARIEREIEDQVPTWSMGPVVKALCSLWGVSTLVAATVLAATGDLARFECPQQLMSYFGLVASEHSSGGSVRRGGITETGNSEVRRILIQSAWAYRYPARISRRKVDAFADGSSAVRQIAWKAQLRLTKRYRMLAARRKPVHVIITAIARELLGFIWAIGQVEKPAIA